MLDLFSELLQMTQNKALLYIPITLPFKASKVYFHLHKVQKYNIFLPLLILVLVFQCL